MRSLLCGVLSFIFLLSRLYGKNLHLVANEVGRKPPTFLDAARIAEAIANTEFTSGKIVYNRFKSVVSYQVSDLPLFSLEAVNKAPKISTYDSLDDDVIKSYMEFSLASLLYYAMKEGACSEQSSRMTAMDNASKNAGMFSFPPYWTHLRRYSWSQGFSILMSSAFLFQVKWLRSWHWHSTELDRLSSPGSLLKLFLEPLHCKSFIGMHYVVKSPWLHPC